MIFLTITAHLEEGQQIRVEVVPSLDNLAGAPPTVIGQCAVLSDHLQQATAMVLHHDGAAPDQSTIDLIGGASEYSGRDN